MAFARDTKLPSTDRAFLRWRGQGVGVPLGRASARCPRLPSGSAWRLGKRTSLGLACAGELRLLLVHRRTGRWELVLPIYDFAHIPGLESRFRAGVGNTIREQGVFLSRSSVDMKAAQKVCARFEIFVASVEACYYLTTSSWQCRPAFSVRNIAGPAGGP